MNCRKVLSLTFFRQNVNATFLSGDWNAVMRVKLFESEQALFPDAQSFVEEENDLKKKLADVLQEIKFLKNIKNMIRGRLFDIQQHVDYTDEFNFDEEVRAIRENRETVTERRRERREKRGRKPSGPVLHCPVDGCNGLVMRNHKCGICHTQVCADCNEVIGEEDHKCDPNKVETVKFINSTTKPCAKCATRIHKTDGCDQMFCTMCHTAFSYQTGQEEHGRIHNPHYFQYLRETQGQVPRNPGDVPPAQIDEERCCVGNELRIVNFMTIQQRLENYPRRYQQRLGELYRTMVHIEEVEKATYRDNGLFKFRNIYDVDRRKAVGERDMRVRFLKGEITKERFAINIRIAQKRAERNGEIYPVLDMVVRVMNDILLSLPPRFDRTDIDLIESNLQRLITIANDSLTNIENVFKIKLFRFECKDGGVVLTGKKQRKRRQQDDE